MYVHPVGTSPLPPLFFFSFYYIKHAFRAIKKKVIATTFKVIILIGKEIYAWIDRRNSIEDSLKIKEE